MEHYSELYAEEENTLDSVLVTVEHLPVMEKLVALQTVEEPSRVIDALPTRRTLGLNVISPKIIICARRVLLRHLLKLLCQG